MNRVLANIRTLRRVIQKLNHRKQLPIKANHGKIKSTENTKSIEDLQQTGFQADDVNITFGEAFSNSTEDQNVQVITRTNKTPFIFNALLFLRIITITITHRTEYIFGLSFNLTEPLLIKVFPLSEGKDLTVFRLIIKVFPLSDWKDLTVFRLIIKVFPLSEGKDLTVFRFFPIGKGKDLNNQTKYSKVFPFGKGKDLNNQTKYSKVIIKVFPFSKGKTFMYFV